MKYIKHRNTLRQVQIDALDFLAKRKKQKVKKLKKCAYCGANFKLASNRKHFKSLCSICKDDTKAQMLED